MTGIEDLQAAIDMKGGDCVIEFKFNKVRLMAAKPNGESYMAGLGVTHAELGTMLDDAATFLRR